jgi:hypothetical protein
MLLIVGVVAVGAMALHAQRAGASKTIALRNSIAGTGCEDDEYLFILNQLANSSDAPSSISVLLSGGGSITVGLSALHNKNAHYSLPAGDVPAGQVPVNAFAVVPDNYSGNFVISHVPCGSPSPSPSPTPAPSPSPNPSPAPSPSPGL